MQYSGTQLLSFVILLVATGCIVASLATDYWDFRSYPALKSYRGLWRGCTETGGEVKVDVFDINLDARVKECYYRFDVTLKDDGEVKINHGTMKTWEWLVLVLMVCSAVISVLSLLSSPCCCNRCGLCLTFWVLIATLCTVFGVGLYAWKASSGDSALTKLLEDNELNFGWSFWLAVLGGVLQLLATLGFGVSRARQHSYSHTI